MPAPSSGDMAPKARAADGEAGAIASPAAQAAQRRATTWAPTRPQRHKAIEQRRTRRRSRSPGHDADQVARSRESTRTPRPGWPTKGVPSGAAPPVRRRR